MHTLQLLGLNWSVTGTGHFQLPVGFQVESRDVETLHLGHGSFPRPVSPRDEHSETVVFKRCEQDKEKGEGRVLWGSYRWGCSKLPASCLTKLLTLGEPGERLKTKNPKVWLSV